MRNIMNILYISTELLERKKKQKISYFIYEETNVMHKI